MKEQIEDYRAKKKNKYAKMIENEHRNNHAEKISIKTVAGYINGYIYMPDKKIKEKLPVLFNLHGGGFVLGFCEQDGKYCKRLANEAQCAVVNIDYCLAPENKFPLPVISTYEFICNVIDKFSQLNFDKSKIVIGGHSAGGNLAAAVTLLAKRNKKHIFTGQILDYPPLNFADSKYDNRDLSQRMSQYIDWYFNSEKDRFDCLASPILADLHDLPRALVISAEYDPLCSEAAAYAQKLKQSKVEVKYYCFKDRMHGFTHDIFQEEYDPKDSNKAWTLMADFLKYCFNLE